MSYSGNRGIIQSGGSINATNLVVGSGGKIHQVISEKSDSMAEAKKQLDALMNGLKAHGSSLENGDEVMQSAQLMKEELAKESPNRLTLTSVLTGIASSVKTVASLATTAEALKVALTALFH